MKKKYLTPEIELFELLSESVCDDDDVLDISDLDNSTDDKTNDGKGDTEDPWVDG